MKPDQVKQTIKQNGQGMAAWTSANAAMATPFNELDSVRDALQAAYRNRMAVLMAWAVAADSPADHLESLANAERCIAQFVSACAWLERQTETALPQSMPVSAA